MGGKSGVVGFDALPCVLKRATQIGRDPFFRRRDLNCITIYLRGRTRMACPFQHGAFGEQRRKEIRIERQRPLQIFSLASKIAGGPAGEGHVQGNRGLPRGGFCRLFQKRRRTCRILSQQGDLPAIE